MATGSGAFVGIDVSKDRLDVAVLEERQGMQVDNRQKGIKELVARMQELQPIPNFFIFQLNKNSNCLDFQDSCCPLC